MEKSPSLVISYDDFHKISSLLPLAKSETAELLEEELGRATLVAPEALSPNAVAMNTTIEYQDVDTGQTQKVTLVYPHEADIDKGYVSILAPIGAALIGLQVGQEIEWPMNGQRTKRIKILSVSQRKSNE